MLCTKYVPCPYTTTGVGDLVRLKEENLSYHTWDVLFQFFLPKFDILKADTTNEPNQQQQEKTSLDY
jgi:hypothetical protein